MSDQTQQLQEQINALKVRVFDTSELIQQYQEHSKQLSDFLSHIASLVGVQPGEAGTVEVQDIFAAVQKLVDEKASEDDSEGE